MIVVDLPFLGVWERWRAAARMLAQAGVPSEDVDWCFHRQETMLFGQRPMPVDGPKRQLTVSSNFLQMAEAVVHHSDPARFDLLYRVLVRLQDEPRLMEVASDPDVHKLAQLFKAVRRDAHKMKAFVRFVETGVGDDRRRRFRAWFEPSHHILEPTAPFFTRRFADMDWLIATPDATAVFEHGVLSLKLGGVKPDGESDRIEDLWRTYYSHTFNPARLKVKAMTAEMPRKYWKNLPEAALIPDLVRGAESRQRDMLALQPKPAPLFAERILAASPHPDKDNSGGIVPATLNEVHSAVAACRRCPLHMCATQAVLGTGSEDAAIMIVGEQPGDEEDLVGRPFVGPAGKVLDGAAAEAGLRMDAAYITNAVKHFKFEMRGKRRLHRRPERDEVDRCRWWLDLERAIVKPKLVVAMGATAAAALTGSGRDLLSRRGRLELSGTTPVLVTLHPAAVLRTRDAGQAAQFRSWIVDDLKTAQAID